MLQIILKVALMYDLHSTQTKSLLDRSLYSATEVSELVKFTPSFSKISLDFSRSWDQQVKVAIELFTFQNNLGGFRKEYETEETVRDSNLRESPKYTNMSRLMGNANAYVSLKETGTEVTVLVLCDSLTSRVAAEFILKISDVRFHLYFLMYDLGPSESLLGDIQLVISTVKKHCNEISSVWIFSDNLLSITTLLDIVCRTRELKLTGVLHVTEWVIVSNLGTDLLARLQSFNMCPDFMTVLSKSSFNGTLISQKSRNGLLTPKGRVTFCSLSCINTGKQFQQSLRDKLESCKYLRKKSGIYLTSKRSVLSGMTLSVSLFPDGQHFMVKNNSNTMNGYAFDLLLHFANFLDFSHNIVLQNISGFYGMANPNGSATGLTGLLKDRKIAFSTMPMSRLESRLKVIDYVPFVINYDPMMLIYRLPKDKNQLDLTYANIFKSDVYVLFIPLLLALALFGAVLHVTTRSCTLKVPAKGSKSDLRSLVSYHEHVCFTSSTLYSGQAGRLLLATWALSWFFLVSAYSTFLVTTFTTNPQELVINSLEKLQSIKDYKVGAYGVATGILSLLELSNKEADHKVWLKLLDDNRTDLRALSSDLDVHAKRVIDENYIWITGNCANMGDVCEEYFTTFEDQIRSYDINGPDVLTYTYIGIPQNTFYKDTLYRSLLEFEQHGILNYLRRKFFSTMVLKSNKASKVSKEQTPVTFRRIQLPVYAVLAGIGLAVGALVTEVVCKSRNVRQFIN